MGGRQGGFELDPLVGLDDPTKPLRSRLLAVPELRARYLDHVHTIANDWLDWEKLGPLVRQYQALIEKEVEADTRKLSSYDEFQRSVSAEPSGPEPGRRPLVTLKAFADQRRKYLLAHPELSKIKQPGERGT